MENNNEYFLVEKGGVWFEEFESSNLDQNRFTENNFIFNAGDTFMYEFKHITTTHEALFFTLNEEADDWKFNWHFVPMDSIDEHTVQKVIITVKAGLEPMIQHIPDYNQTVIQYDYPTTSGKIWFNSVSGVVDNENNIWMHPPRDKYFRILELNPFPFIKAPYEIGNQWDWTLEIGSSWGDQRWKVWEGQIENRCDYSITEKKKITTKLGEIECFVIESTAKSRIGETMLISYFNPQFGFIKLDYTNIDGSKTILELVEYKKAKNGR